MRSDISGQKSFTTSFNLSKAKTLKNRGFEKKEELKIQKKFNNI